MFVTIISLYLTVFSVSFIPFFLLELLCLKLGKNLLVKNIPLILLLLLTVTAVLNLCDVIDLGIISNSINSIVAFIYCALCALGITTSYLFNSVASKHGK